MGVKIDYILIIISILFNDNKINTTNKGKNSAINRNLSIRSDRIKEVLEENGIIPDTLDSIPLNISQLRVVYSNGINLKLGDELTPTQVKDKPTQVNWQTKSNRLYTVCMTDPDIPSRRYYLFREFLHWLVVNIPGNQVNDGDILKDYIGSTPPKGTGLHRYVFLAYRQLNRLNASQVRLSTKRSNSRTKFRINDFAKNYNLGEPVAVNFYLAKWDDYVTKFYRDLFRKI